MWEERGSMLFSSAYEGLLLIILPKVTGRSMDILNADIRKDRLAFKDVEVCIEHEYTSFRNCLGENLELFANANPS